MDGILRIRKSTLFFWALAIFLPLLWLWPEFRYPSFGIIDDPDLLMSYEGARKDFFSWWKLHGFHGEPEDGRIKPVAQLFVFLFYFMPARFNALGWVIIHYITFAVTLTLLFFFMHTLTKRAWLACLTCSLWSLGASSVLSWSRFHIQDPYQALWLMAVLVTLLTLLKTPGPRPERLWIALLGILTFCLYFIKETTVLLLPASFLVFIACLCMKQNRKAWGYFFGFNLVFCALFFYLKPKTTGYTQESLLYSLDLVLFNLKGYARDLEWRWLILVMVVSYLYRTIWRKRCFENAHSERWQLGMLMLAAAFFVPYLPWRPHVRRYLLISELFLAIFSGLELSYWFSRFSGRRGRLAVGFTVLALALSSTAGLSDVLKDRFKHAGWREPVQGLKWFSEYAKPNANVILLVEAQEILYSTALYIEHFFHRDDITILSMSSHAQQYHDEGFNIQPYRMINADMLRKADYLLWYRRGVERARLDGQHLGIVVELYKTPIGRQMKLVYENLLFTNEIVPEGVQIWEFPRARATGG